MNGTLCEDNFWPIAHLSNQVLLEALFAQTMSAFHFNRGGGLLTADQATKDFPLLLLEALIDLDPVHVEHVLDRPLRVVEVPLLELLHVPLRFEKHGTGHGLADGEGILDPFNQGLLLRLNLLILNESEGEPAGEPGSRIPGDLLGQIGQRRLVVLALVVHVIVETPVHVFFLLWVRRRHFLVSLVVLHLDMLLYNTNQKSCRCYFIYPNRV